MENHRYFKYKKIKSSYPRPGSVCIWGGRYSAIPMKYSCDFISSWYNVKGHVQMLYIFIFVLFLGKNTQKAKHPQIVILYSAEGNLKYVSQTLHPSSQNTRKKGGSPSFYIYIYIKHMGICFYTHWTLFQIYNGYLKKILRGKYCQQSYTINTDKRRSLCGVSITRERKNK